MSHRKREEGDVVREDFECLHQVVRSPSEYDMQTIGLFFLTSAREVCSRMSPGLTQVEHILVRVCLETLAPLGIQIKVFLFISMIFINWHLNCLLQQQGGGGAMETT